MRLKAGDGSARGVEEGDLMAVLLQSSEDEIQSGYRGQSS
jgi:hypothetical protein